MHRVEVFVSHSWSHSGHYEKLCEWIFVENWRVNDVGISFGNTSIPKDNPIHNAANVRQLEQAILNRIALSQVVVCPTGMYMNYSKWIACEIAGSEKLGVGLLAVNPWGQQRKSSVVQQAADICVGWNKQSVVDAIWKIANKRKSY